LDKFNIIIVESDGSEIHNPKEHNLLNFLSVSLQCKLFLSEDYKGSDISNINVYENELKVVTKIDNVEYSFL
jgi:hypothetical protein